MQDIAKPLPIDWRETRTLLQNPETEALTLATIMLSSYPDTDFGDEEAVTIIKSLEEDYKVDIPEENENKLNAIILVLTSDAPLVTREAFDAVALAFADGNIGDLIYGGDEELNGCYIIWALEMIALLTGDSFSEVIDYIPDSLMEYLNSILDAEGVDVELSDDITDDVPYYHNYVSDHMRTAIRELTQIGIRNIPEEYINI